MVGIITVCVLIIQVSFISPVFSTLFCPEGIRFFSSGVKSNTYYVCNKAKQEPVLKSCKSGYFYWPHKGECHGRENAAKDGGQPDLIIYKRATLGATVFLGDLYDSNSGEMFTGYSFWRRQTILDSKIRSVLPSVTVNVFPTRSKMDRLQSTRFSSAVKTDILGDLIRVEGSALYLKDNLKSMNEAAVVLTYLAKTKTDTLPVLTKKDFDACEVNGPTHVVTSISYGMGVNFIFKKTLEKDERMDEVLQNLEVAVNAIKTTKSEISDPIKKVVKNVRVDFFADFVPEREPGDYAESLRMYQSLPTRIGKFPYSNNTVMIDMQLMPIRNFCEKKSVTHIAISDDILHSVRKMLGEMEEAKLKITTLKMDKNVKNYLPLIESLQTLSEELISFELRMKKELQITIPRIRGGNGSEVDLIRLLNQYAESPFYHSKIKPFLRNRLREINMLNYILDPLKREGTDIKIVTYEDVSDIRTMFIKPFVLMLTFNLLQSNQLVRKFLKGEMVDETKSWYNNQYNISAMGIAFKNFVKFSSFNKNSNTNGYLLGIGDANGKLITVNAQKEGLLYAFTFPHRPPKVVSTSDTHKSITFVVKRPADSWITGLSISYWKHGRSGETTSRTYSFSRGNKTFITINQLAANNVYEFSSQYVTPMGFSQPSIQVTFLTRPCSAPTNLRTSVVTADYFKIYWDPPTTCGKGATAKKYNVTVTGLNNFIRTIIVERVTNVDISSLQAASKYDVQIVAIFDKNAFNWTQEQRVVTSLPSSLQVITLPDAPLYLSLANRSIHSAVVVWAPTKKVAVRGVVQKYRVKYQETNNRGNVSKQGTEMIVWTTHTWYRLTGLTQGTTYAVSVQVVTSAGTSAYSPKLIVKTMYKETELDSLRHTVEQEMEHSTLKLQKQIEGEVKRIDNVQENEKEARERNEQEIQRKTSAVSARVGDIETAIYRNAKLKFIGFGYYGTQGSYLYKNNLSLEDCIQFCVEKRRTSGTEWNGFYYNFGDSNLRCECCTRDSGHSQNSQFLHYRFI